MSSRLKTVIICICAAVAVIAAALFGIYKYFVTPQRIVLLSLMDVKDELEESFSYLEEGGIENIKDYLSDGGKLESELTITDTIFSNDVKVKLTSNKDENCTVSEVMFDDKFNFEIYKDRKQIYINTPLFDGGFRIPVETFAQEWNSSIFKDIAAVPESYGISGLIKDFVLGNYDAEDFAKSRGKDIASLAGGIEIEKTGTAAVMDGSKTKRAGEYTAHVTKAQAEEFTELLVKYITESGYGSQKLEEIAELSGITKDEAADALKTELKSMVSDMDIIFKINGTELRELVISANGKSYTIAFEGEKNRFDMMSFYIDGDIQNSWRRNKSGNAGNITDKITKGSESVVTLENARDGFDLRLNYYGTDIYVNAHGMKDLGEVTEYEGFELGVEDIFTLTGTLNINDKYDDNFSFNKSGSYIDLLSITNEEWEAVSGVLVAGIKIISENGGTE